MSKIIQEVTADGVHLPKAVVDQFGWGEGERVVFEVHGRRASVYPQELTRRDIAEIACTYLLEKVGDAVAIRTPQRIESRWAVDVVLPHARKVLGRILFTLEGVLTEESDSPSTLQARANED